MANYNFTISKSALNKELKVLSKMVASKSTMPILTYFLFEVRDDKLFITAANENGRMTSSAPCKCGESFRFCIDAKTVTEAISSLPEQPVEFILSELDIEIKYEGGSFSMVGEDPEKFISLRKTENSTHYEVSAQCLSNGLNGASFCAASDDLRPVISGVYFEFTPNSLNIVSTDGFALALYQANDVSFEEEKSFILPRQIVGSLISAISCCDINDIVKIDIDANNVSFKFQNVEFVSRTVEGRYPNYRSVFPESDKECIIDSTSLKKVVSRVGLFANSSNVVSISFNEQSLIISCENPDFRKSSKEECPVISYSGSPVKLGLNHSILADILSHCSDEVHIELSAANKALIFKSSDNLTFLQMPLQTI